MRGLVPIVCIAIASVYYGRTVGWEQTFQSLGLNTPNNYNESKPIRYRDLTVGLNDYDCSIDFDEITVKGNVTNSNNRALLLRVEVAIDFEDGGVIEYSSKDNDMLILPPNETDSFYFTGATNNNFGLESCDLKFLDVASHTYIGY